MNKVDNKRLGCDISFQSIADRDAHFFLQKRSGGHHYGTDCANKYHANLANIRRNFSNSFARKYIPQNKSHSKIFPETVSSRFLIRPSQCFK
jgi:hypothetical protein